MLKKNNKKIITLLTDFGLQDPYVGEIKGTIFSINFDAKVIDISHKITSYDIQEAAFLLGMYYSKFPEDTIHLAVVDPGVGGDRKNIIVKTKKYFFVGPDNGIFTKIFELEPKFSVYQITKLPQNVSNTFHGRDVFAPIAAYLSKSESLYKLGKPIKTFKKLSFPEPEIDEHLVVGQIMYIDGFGNLITNIHKDNIDFTRNMVIRVGKVAIDEIGRTFSSVSPGKPVAYIGSHNYLEIGINKGIANKSLGTGKGSSVEILYY